MTVREKTIIISCLHNLSNKHSNTALKQIGDIVLDCYEQNEKLPPMELALVLSDCVIRTNVISNFASPDDELKFRYAFYKATKEIHERS